MEYQFPAIVGVSGGSIVSSLYCAGMPLADIKQLALDTDFRQFREFSITRLLFEGGLASGDHFEQWMDRQLDGITFAQLEANLHILATDLHSGKPIIFNRTQSPDMPVSRAIRYSMSIPLIFSFKRFNDCPVTDGAILAEDALFEDWNGDGTPGVCFRLKSDEAPVRGPRRAPLIPLKYYVELLIRTFMNAISREYVNAQYWHNTVVVNTGHVSAVDFNLSPEAKLHLFHTGYQTAKEFVPRKLAGLDQHQAQKKAQ